MKEKSINHVINHHPAKNINHVYCSQEKAVSLTQVSQCPAPSDKDEKDRVSNGESRCTAAVTAPINNAIDDQTHTLVEEFSKQMDISASGNYSSAGSLSCNVHVLQTGSALSTSYKYDKTRQYTIGCTCI